MGIQHPTPNTQRLSLGVLALLALSFRILTLFALRFGGFFSATSDFDYYRQIGALSAQGFYPAIHFWVEYPPLLPWLAVAAYRLSSYIPPWQVPSFWFDAIFTVILSLADVGTIVLIDRIGDRLWGPGGGRRSAVFYALLFLPVYEVLGWFDGVPTFFLLLGVWLALTRRPIASGGALGIGFMFKLFPIFALPAVLLWDRNRVHRALMVVGAAVVVVAVAAPFLIVSPATFLATFINIASRGSWESPWALLDGNDKTGGVADLKDRLFYNASAWWGEPTHYAVLWWFVAGIAVVGYLWLLWQRRRGVSERGVVGLTALALALFLLLSRGFSPQFTLWLLPFVALLLPGLTGATIATLLTVNNVLLEGYVFVTVFWTIHAFLVVTVTIRTILLLWLLVELSAVLDPPVTRSLGKQWPVWRRRLAVPAGAIALVGCVVGLAALAPLYRAKMLDRDPAAAAIRRVAALPADTTLVLTQPELYDRVFAYTRPHPTRLYADERALTWKGDQLLYRRLTNDVSLNHPIALVVDQTATSQKLLSAIRSWLIGHDGQPTVETVGNTTIEQFDPSRRPTETKLGAMAGNFLEINGFALSQTRVSPGAAFTTTIDFRGRATIDRDYTVSLQLIGPDGHLAAQHDEMPVANSFPTSLWQPGDVVPDAITLATPRSLHPGEYRLIAVIYYAPTGQRVPITRDGATSDHLDLGTIRVG